MDTFINIIGLASFIYLFILGAKAFKKKITPPPALVKETRDPLGVVEVHLAAKGLDPIGLTYEGAVARHHEISSSGPLTWEAAVGPEIRCT